MVQAVIYYIGNKSKNWQMGLYQTKNLLHNKGNNQQNEEITYRMEEYPFQLWSDRGLIPKMHKKFKKPYKRPKIYEKCSILSAIREIQIKTTMKYHLALVGMAILLKQNKTK